MFKLREDRVFTDIDVLDVVARGHLFPVQVPLVYYSKLQEVPSMSPEHTILHHLKLHGLGDL